MKLRAKILAGYGVSLALVILVGAWGVANLWRLGQASEAILRENYRSIRAAEGMVDALERQDSATLISLSEVIQRRLIYLQIIKLNFLNGCRELRLILRFKAKLRF